VAETADLLLQTCLLMLIQTEHACCQHSMLSVNEI